MPETENHPKPSLVKRYAGPVAFVTVITGFNAMTVASAVINYKAVKVLHATELLKIANQK
jgi:hypothetical protein